MPSKPSGDSRKRRGKFLTIQGLNRLQAGIACTWQQEPSTTFRTPGHDWLSDLWSCDAKTVRKILNRTERVDYGTLTAAFLMSGLTIRTEDYSDDKEESGSDLPAHPLPSRSIRRHEFEEQCRQHLLQTRMVTLIGPGGIGKTFLARCLTHQLKETFSEVYWISLDTVFMPEHVVATIASTLGIAHMPDREKSLYENIGAKRVLIILDNCEHLLTECAHIAELLLTRCRNLAILATSREALNIPGETVCGVAPLDIPPDAHGYRQQEAVTESDVTALMQHTSVQFFEICARSAVPEFKITPSNAHYVARICRQTDGIPLAIEIVAARLLSATEALIMQESERMLNLLPNPIRTTGLRHTTLKEVMDWSFQLLDDAEQHLLCRLSVFRGGCDLEAVQAVCADPLFVDSPSRSIPLLLNRLVTASLVVFDRSRGRYRLLEPIRQFAESRLKTLGENEQWVCRHANYYLRLSESLQPRPIGAQQRQTLDRLEAEYPNFRLILDNTTLEAACGMQLCVNIHRLWIMRGRLQEGYRYCEKWETRGAADALHMKFCLAHGLVLFRFGMRQEALANYRQGLRLARANRQTEHIAEALQRLGNLYFFKQKYRLAHHLNRMSIDYWRRVKSVYGEATCLGQDAIVLQRLGRYEEARDQYEGSLTRLAGFQDDYELGTILANYTLHAKELALAAEAVGERNRLLQTALDRGLEALKYAQAINDQARIGQVLYELGIVELRREQHIRARDYLLQGLPLLQMSGELSKFLECLLYLARIHVTSTEYSTTEHRAEVYQGLMSLLAYIDMTKTRYALHWIKIVETDFTETRDLLASRLSDQELKRATREGCRLERASAAMLANSILSAIQVS